MGRPAADAAAGATLMAAPIESAMFGKDDNERETVFPQSEV
jgi:hypothetical protein